jgi:hypothetical protein
LSFRLAGIYHSNAAAMNIRKGRKPLLYPLVKEGISRFHAV